MRWVNQLIDMKVNYQLGTFIVVFDQGVLLVSYK